MSKVSDWARFELLAFQFRGLQCCLVSHDRGMKGNGTVGGNVGCLLTITGTWMFPATQQNIDRPQFRHYNFAPRAKEGLSRVNNSPVIKGGSETAAAPDVRPNS